MCNSDSSNVVPSYPKGIGVLNMIPYLMYLGWTFMYPDKETIGQISPSYTVSSGHVKYKATPFLTFIRLLPTTWTLFMFKQCKLSPRSLHRASVRSLVFLWCTRNNPIDWIWCHLWAASLAALSSCSGIRVNMTSHNEIILPCINVCTLSEGIGSLDRRCNGPKLCMLF